MLVSLQAGNKDQGVVVFNFFHSRFSGQWMFDDVVCICKIIVFVLNIEFLLEIGYFGQF